MPAVDTDVSLEDSSEEGCCWVCQGVIEDNGDLFYPCNCKLHRKCIKEWVAKVSWKRGEERVGEREGGRRREMEGGKMEIVRESERDVSHGTVIFTYPESLQC